MMDAGTLVHGEAVIIDVGRVSLDGNLTVPGEAEGLVIFAHGSGSSRFSPRNQSVAATLNRVGLGTLLFDLLTPSEFEADEQTRSYRFDIPLLAKRLTEAVDWIANRPATRGLSVGLFGASTGAAAALVTAADRPKFVHAVVSRGGRPDLAAGALLRVQAPTLLIVGGNDTQVLELNRKAVTVLSAVNRLEIVAGATHLFEEPGALDEVAQLAREWFLHYLTARKQNAQ